MVCTLLTRSKALRAGPPGEFCGGEILPEKQVQQWLGACGRDVRVYRGCRIVGAERVKLGDHSQIDEGVCIFAGEGVTIGAHVHLAFGSSISGGGACEIGDFAGIGAGVRLITGSDLADGSGLTGPTVPDKWRAVRRERVVIGAHALVFTNALILPGVTVGGGAVVAAGSIVHHDLKPWRLYAGNPLTQIGVRPKTGILRLAASLHKSPRR